MFISLFFLHILPGATINTLFRSSCIWYGDTITMLKAFAKRYIVVGDFETFSGKAHFRIRKVKRGKVYYNPCTSLPKRLRSYGAFEEALMTKEIIVVVHNIPENNYILDEFGKIIGFAVTYENSVHQFEF